jgi:hypothetical protein
MSDVMMSDVGFEGEEVLKYNVLKIRKAGRLSYDTSQPFSL